ncbi:MAG TPA: DUF3037 domain-containing protein [Mycobacteriales bacterium]|nr:DUF3037 domain-containing protein [Mycobacteriales bacterium]
MTRSVFEYAVLRAVPRIERGEAVNIGVVLYCQDADLLRAVVHVDPARLRALDPGVDVDGVRGAAVALDRTCAGEGPAGQTSLGQRFRWLTAPRSTVVQPGPVHSGLTDDAAAELQRLVAALVE